MIQLLWLALLVLRPVSALVPVEGILMGQANSEIQADPLSTIFGNGYDLTQTGENRKVRLYRHFYESGADLTQECGRQEAPRYSSSWMEKQAKRSMASTLQYLGLDLTVKAVAAYARRLEVGEEDFKRLASHAVVGYCSRNTTVFSLRKIERSLLHYYQNPPVQLIPSVEASPFATQAFKLKTEAAGTRSREFDQALAAFRSFCSWGGDVADYRLMAPYLRNPFIMSLVIKNMLGEKDAYEPMSGAVVSLPDPDAGQVACTDLVCRDMSATEFNRAFPLSQGSTGLRADLTKLYCHHFRHQDYPGAATIPEVRQWVKEAELEDPILETGFFMSLLTGVPDAMLGVESYNEVPFLVKSTIDERWNDWARGVLSTFSQDLLYEESLKVKAVPRRERGDLRVNGFRLDFSVTLGEMDRLMDATDKLEASFNFKLSKNYLRGILSKWHTLAAQVDVEGQAGLKQDIARYLGLQLKTKEKLFLQKMWTEDFTRLMAEELLLQVRSYRGPMFDSLRDEVLDVPVNFSYGVFALGYLRYRADVNSGRLKLNL